MIERRWLRRWRAVSRVTGVPMACVLQVGWFGGGGCAPRGWCVEVRAGHYWVTGEVRCAALGCGADGGDGFCGDGQAGSGEGCGDLLISLAGGDEGGDCLADCVGYGRDRCRGCRCRYRLCDRCGCCGCCGGGRYRCRCGLCDRLCGCLVGEHATSRCRRHVGSTVDLAGVRRVLAIRVETREGHGQLATNIDGAGTHLVHCLTDGGEDGAGTAILNNPEGALTSVVSVLRVTLGRVEGDCDLHLRAGLLTVPVGGLVGTELGRLACVADLGDGARVGVAGVGELPGVGGARCEEIESGHYGFPFKRGGDKKFGG
nr:MAG TPA: hypothetical protein [Caudoviricetes sp.]